MILIISHKNENAMSNESKEKDMKNGTYYFFDDIISIKNLDPNKIMVGKNWHKNIFIYYEKCMKAHENQI